jgi:hypothetical protein
VYGFKEVGNVEDLFGGGLDPRRRRLHVEWLGEPREVSAVRVSADEGSVVVVGCGVGAEVLRPMYSDPVYEREDHADQDHQ